MKINHFCYILSKRLRNEQERAENEQERVEEDYKPNPDNEVGELYLEDILPTLQMGAMLQEPAIGLIIKNEYL